MAKKCLVSRAQFRKELPAEITLNLTLTKYVSKDKGSMMYRLGGNREVTIGGIKFYVADNFMRVLIGSNALPYSDEDKNADVAAGIRKNGDE